MFHLCCLCALNRRLLTADVFLHLPGLFRVKEGSCPKPVTTSESCGRTTSSCRRATRRWSGWRWTTSCSANRCPSAVGTPVSEKLLRGWDGDLGLTVAWLTLASASLLFGLDRGAEKRQRPAASAAAAARHRAERRSHTSVSWLERPEESQDRKRQTLSI